MPQWAEIAIRTTVAVVVLFLATKLLGKKQVSQISLFEYITGITIGSIAAYISLDLDAHWALGIVSLFVWVAISWGLEFWTLKSKTVRDFVEGKTKVIIRDGKILEDNLRKVKYSGDDLLEQLRAKNIFSVADVEFAVLESDGKLSAQLKKENQPLTPRTLNWYPPPEQIPFNVIMDGKMMDHPLHQMGKNRDWLNKELARLGMKLEDVYFMQADDQGQVYLDKYDNLARRTGDKNDQI
jgi:uncharacterized membrane protein YcaP (DUF421 family)